jgi:hypothetical protein
MLTGRSPFVASTPMGTLAAILSDQPASIQSLRSDVPGELGRLVEQCLQKDRDLPTSTQAPETRHTALSGDFSVGSCSRVVHDVEPSPQQRSRRVETTMPQRSMTNEIGNNSVLSDGELLAEVKRLTAIERHATSRLIAALGELDARRLYLSEGCWSLFTYCTQVLHLSEHAAYLRIEAARAARSGRSSSGCSLRAPFT